MTQWPQAKLRCFLEWCAVNGSVKVENMNKIIIYSALLALCLSSCARKEPEGPAEQIGKGIDQLSKGIQQLDKDNPETDYYRSRKPVARANAPRVSEPLPSITREANDPLIDSGDGSTSEHWETFEEWKARKARR